MSNTNKIEPFVKEKHLKLKAWNEYVIDYFDLKIEKKVDTGYLAIQIYQGRFMIYNDTVNQAYSRTPAQMHERLYHFLNLYRLAIKPFGVVYEDANFKPPRI